MTLKIIIASKFNSNLSQNQVGEERRGGYTYGGCLGVTHERKRGCMGFLDGHSESHSTNGCGLCFRVCVPLHLQSSPLVHYQSTILSYFHFYLKIIYIHKSTCTTLNSLGEKEISPLLF
jgi:hypothetical protein